MTEPTPPDSGPPPPPKPAPPPAKGKPQPARVDLLDVVEYVHHNPVLRRDHRGLGVVEGIDDGAITIRPLAHHSVRVDPGDVTKLPADDGG